MAGNTKDLFLKICNFARRYNKQKGLKTNSIETLEVREALQEFKSWIVEKCPEMNGIPLTCEVSKGSSSFPRVTWVAILPPEQRVTRGVYFVMCFGREGAGAVAGCISSVTSRTGLTTVRRSARKPLRINVDGDRDTTRYNDAFANPREITVDSFDEGILLEHIKKSLLRSFEYIRNEQNPFLYPNDEAYELPDNGSQLGRFDPSNIEDTRQAIFAAIKIRQGQGKFRRELLKAYDSKCAITGFNVIAALEAAHIVPYRGRHTNKVSNGLILRADLHTLFDLNLIAINTSMRVLLSPSLYGTCYEKFARTKIDLPRDTNKQPSREALAWRMLYFNNGSNSA
jgi:hypothetical protein